MTITPQSAEGYSKADCLCSNGAMRPCLLLQLAVEARTRERSVAGDSPLPVLCLTVFSGRSPCRLRWGSPNRHRAPHSTQPIIMQPTPLPRSSEIGSRAQEIDGICDCIYDPCGWSAGNFSVPAGGKKSDPSQNQSYDILKWELTYSGDWQANQSIAVWDGGGDRSLGQCAHRRCGQYDGSYHRRIPAQPAGDPRTAGNGASPVDRTVARPRLAVRTGIRDHAQ